MTSQKQLELSHQIWYSHQPQNSLAGYDRSQNVNDQGRSHGYMATKSVDVHHTALYQCWLHGITIRC